MIHLSTNLSDYANILRDKPFSAKDVTEAETKLNTLTMTTIDKLENKLDETRQRILIKTALARKA